MDFHRWERTHPQRAERGSANKSPPVKALAAPHFCAAKRDAAHRDVCAPGKKRILRNIRKKSVISLRIDYIVD